MLQCLRWNDFLTRGCIFFSHFYTNRIFAAIFKLKMPLKKRPKSAPFGGLGKSDNVVEVSHRRISEAWKDTESLGKIKRTSLPEESDSAKTRPGPGSVHSADDPVTSTLTTPRKPLVRAKSAPLSFRRRRSALQQRQLSLTSQQRNNPGIDG